MKIDHAILIAKQVAISDIRKDDIRQINTPQFTWKMWSVGKALKNPTLMRLLEERHRDQDIEFDFGSNIEENERKIYDYVIHSLEQMIAQDCLPLQAHLAAVKLPPEVLQDGLVREKAYYFHLEQMIDEIAIENDSYQNTRPYTLDLITLENLKKPDFGLQYFESEEEIAQHIQYCIANGIEHSPMILYRDDYSHTVYFDYKVIDGKPHLLMLDSIALERQENREEQEAQTQNHGANDQNLYVEEIDQKMKKSLAQLDTPVGFIACGTDVQKSQWGCNMFALNFAKQAYRDKTALDELHRADPLADQVLLSTMIPARFLKHDQSLADMSALTAFSTRARFEPVNQKQKTLLEYAQDHRYQPSHKTYKQQQSLWEKRQAYLVELRDALS